MLRAHRRHRFHQALQCHGVGSRAVSRPDCDTVGKEGRKCPAVKIAYRSREVYDGWGYVRGPDASTQIGEQKTWEPHA